MEINNLPELYILSNALEGQIYRLQSQLKDPAWDDAPVSKARARKSLFDTEQLRERILDEIRSIRKILGGIA